MIHGQKTQYHSIMRHARGGGDIGETVAFRECSAALKKWRKLNGSESRRGKGKVECPREGENTHRSRGDAEPFT